jgi:O-antigen ligase
VIYITLIRKEFIYKILTGFIFGIFFSEIISYFMLFDVRFSWITYTGVGLNVPFMNSYTQYAEMLSISMGILLYGIIYKQENKYLKVLGILFFISASINIFIIQSKLGYALYTVSILTVTFMILMKYKKYVMIPIAIFLIFGGYFTAYKLSDIFKNRVDGFFNQTEMAVESRNYHTSTGIRIGYYDHAFNFFKENFLFGVGTNDHSVEFLKFIEENEKNTENMIALRHGLSAGGFANFDSELLDISVQFGFIGLLILFNIFWQLYNYQVDDYYFNVIQVIFITILLTTSMVSGLFMYVKVGKIFTFLSALTLKHFYDNNFITCSANKKND